MASSIVFPFQFDGRGRTALAGDPDRLTLDVLQPQNFIGELLPFLRELRRVAELTARDDRTVPERAALDQDPELAGVDQALLVARRNPGTCAEGSHPVMEP